MPAKCSELKFVSTLKNNRDMEKLKAIAGYLFDIHEYVDKAYQDNPCGQSRDEMFKLVSRDVPSPRFFVCASAIRGACGTYLANARRHIRPASHCREDAERRAEFPPGSLTYRGAGAINVIGNGSAIDVNPDSFRIILPFRLVGDVDVCSGLRIHEVNLKGSQVFCSLLFPPKFSVRVKEIVNSKHGMLDLVVSKDSRCVFDVTSEKALTKPPGSFL